MKTLLIYYNEHYPNQKKTYVLRQTDNDGEVISEREYKRCPRAAIFDEVYENGSGSRLSHRDKRLWKHPLLKTK